MKRPTNFTQLAHENYMLKIKYNELLNSHLLLLSKHDELTKKCEEDPHDYTLSLNVLQNRNADLNRQLLENHRKHIEVVSAAK